MHASELLDPGGYTHDMIYDALNRVTQHTLPTDVTGHRGVLTAVYNRAGSLGSVRYNGTVYVERISYDAKGRRSLIVYGNGIMTRYAYDPHTFRLVRLRTEPCSVDANTYRAKGSVQQDLRYEYDLVGNILAIYDRAPGNGVSPTVDALDRKFTYDALYRLRTATGREHQTPVGGDPWIDIPRGIDPTKTQKFLETYSYDPAGNLLNLVHQPSGPHLTAGYSREFHAQADSNRLVRMTVGGMSYDHGWDGAGNLTSETTTRHFAWNHANRLCAFSVQTPGGAEPSIHVQYLYSSTGERILKLVRRQGGLVDVTHYVGGFEHHRWESGASNYTHIVDDKQRVAIVRVGPEYKDDRIPAVTYELSDHLGSTVATFDDAGALVNREEFLPYGETALGGYASKRYRFNGKERDEESGLMNFGMRYYAPWLARWMSPDPIGPSAGLNPYEYVRSRPMNLRDKVGLAPDDPFPPDPSRSVADNLAMMSTPSVVLQSLASAWNAFRTKLTNLAFDREAYDRARASGLATVAPNPGLEATGDIVKRTPEASGNAFLVLAGGIGKGGAPTKLSGELPTAEAEQLQISKSPLEIEPPTKSQAATSLEGLPQQVAQGTVETVAAELFRLRDAALNEAIGRVQANPSLANSMTPARFGNLVDEIFKDGVLDSISANRLPQSMRLTPTSNKGVAYGIDVWDAATGEGYDLHPGNMRQVLKHMETYEDAVMPDGTQINNVNPLCYESPWRK
jgi:RHS repeat-associated protein